MQSNINTVWKEGFRKKFGRFYVEGNNGINDIEPGELAIASDDIENFIQQLLAQRNEEIIKMLDTALDRGMIENPTQAQKDFIAGQDSALKRIIEQIKQLRI